MNLETAIEPAAKKRKRRKTTDAQPGRGVEKEITCAVRETYNRIRARFLCFVPLAHFCGYFNCGGQDE